MIKGGKSGLATLASIAFLRKSDPTITLTQKKKMQFHADEEPRGTSSSKKTVSLKNPPLYKYVKDAVTYRDQYWISQATDGGFKECQALGSIGTRNQWIFSEAGSTRSNRTDHSYAAWFDLQPAGGLAAGVNSTASTSPVMDKAGISSVQMIVDIVNLSNVPVNIAIHGALCKDKTNESPLKMAEDLFSQSSMYSSDFAFPATKATIPITYGNINPVYVASGSNVTEKLFLPAYTSLWSLRGMKKYYKPVLSHTLQLGSNASHRVVINVIMNTKYLKETIVQDDASNFVKNSLFFWYEAQGVAVVDNSAGAVTNVPTLGPSKTGVVVNRKVKICPLKVPAGRFETTYLGSQLTYRAAVADTKILAAAAEVAVAAGSI